MTKSDLFDWTVEIRIRGHVFSAAFVGENEKNRCLEDLDVERYSARVFYQKQLVQDWEG